MTRKHALLIIITLFFFAAGLLACGSADGEACALVRVTSCAKFVDGELVDFYTRTGASCQTCRSGYIQSCAWGCD